ncbi:hypothetical protein Ancab_008913 [Ancistrocladus abbreviatus]
MGSVRQSTTADWSKERLLSRKQYSELGLGRSDGGDEGLEPNFWHTVQGKIQRSWMKVKEAAFKAYEMGRSDPRKVIFAAKMGLALAFISLLIFFKEPFDFISQNSLWAVMTVVVVFEFSIGATFNKGFNRALGTFSAGALSVGIGMLSVLAGKLEEAIIVISIFIAGFCASYAKLHPTMKDYEYGFRVFLLTYCIVLVSGSDFTKVAVTRLLLIACGAAVCLVVNTFIYPIWAGEDLHKMIVKNFRDVANSLDGCVNGYVQCVQYDRVPSKILTFQASDDPLYSGYRSVVESASKEDSLMAFAHWEPPHGRYRMWNYPWDLFIKVSGAVRHCALMVMAMHGCMLSEIQAPAELRRAFSNELKRVGTEGAKVLHEIGNKVEKMEKLSPGDMLTEVHRAAEELQMSIDQKSYLLVNSENWGSVTQPKEFTDPESFLDSKEQEQKPLAHSLKSVSTLKNGDSQPPNTAINISFSKSGSSEDVFRRQISWPSRQPLDHEILLNEREVRTYESASALSLATFASLLIEFVARLQNLVDSFNELSEKAKFKEPIDQTGAENEAAAGFWTKLFRRS